MMAVSLHPGVLDEGADEGNGKECGDGAGRKPGEAADSDQEPVAEAVDQV